MTVKELWELVSERGKLVLSDSNHRLRSISRTTNEERFIAAKVINRFGDFNVRHIYSENDVIIVELPVSVVRPFAEKLYATYVNRGKFPHDIYYRLVKGQYVTIADVYSFDDESEGNDIPLVYYVYDIVNGTTYKVTGIDPTWNEDSVEPTFSEETVELINGDDENTGNIEEIAYAANCVMGDYPTSYEDPEDAEACVISPGYPARLWLDNGDPGYPGEAPEIEYSCPFDGTELDEEEEGAIVRCSCCKFFYKIPYSA